MRWPNHFEVMKALEAMPRHPLIAGLLRLDALKTTEKTLLIDVVAYDIVAGANDIPNPRLTHCGPWTKGWTPF